MSIVPCRPVAALDNHNCHHTADLAAVSPKIQTHSICIGMPRLTLKPLPRNSCGIIITLHHLQTAGTYHLQRRMKHYVTKSPPKIKGTAINPTGRFCCSKTL